MHRIDTLPLKLMAAVAGEGFRVHDTVLPTTHRRRCLASTKKLTVYSVSFEPENDPVVRGLALKVRSWSAAREM
jgi:hypothetical protein